MIDLYYLYQINRNSNSLCNKKTSIKINKNNNNKNNNNKNNNNNNNKIKNFLLTI